MKILCSLQAWAEKLSNLLNKTAIALIAIALATMTVVVFTQVVFRVVEASIPWSEELARYLMIYLTFLGASIGIKYKAHIAIEVLITALPHKFQQMAELLVSVILAVTCGILVWYGLMLVDTTMIQSSPALKIKMGYIYASIVIGATFSLVHLINNFLADIIVILSPPKEGEVQA